ncbi:MAG: alpha/beta hydrolase [Legionella sp.]|jgi:pimeloyl-ACP methyl ester carboxylesterase
MKPKTLNNALSLELKDGRQIGYAEFGNPDGQPILYFHGLPSSRLEAGHLHEVAVSNNFRLIGLDRPGMGLSSIEPKRSILSWVQDVEAFADSIGIDKFSIVGHSGGAPFVAACAYTIPHRLTGAAIVSGMAPFEIPEATASLSGGQRTVNSIINTIPLVAKLMMKLTFIMLNIPRMLQQMIKQMPEVDQRVFSDPESCKAILDATNEAFRSGVSGTSQEIVLSLKPWGFKLENIIYPITIWQGGMDKQAPEMHARIYAKLIPNAKLLFFKDEGHISILKNHGEEILRRICL